MTDIQSVTDDVPCGCGPTAEEARTLRGGITRRRALSAGAIGVFLAATGASLAPSAFAAEYPTWDDVEEARNNEAAKGAEVTRIQGLIRSLEQDVDTKQAEADRLGQEHVLALEAYEDAVARAESLQQQADAESARADAAAAKLGALAADQYRSGNTDPTLDLFFSGSAGSAEDLLSRLGSMDRLVDANREVYADAAGARDSARHLSDQAQVARDERNRREAEAEQKMQTAQAAAQAALAALASQNGYRDVLDAQLAALQDTTSRTISQYQAGVEVRRREREARIRRVREAAAARAREEERRRREEERRRQAPNNVGAGGESSSSGGGGGRSSPPGGFDRRTDGSARGSEPAAASAVTATAPAPATGGLTSRAAADPRSTPRTPAPSSLLDTAAHGATTSRSSTQTARSLGTRTSSTVATTSTTGNECAPVKLLRTSAAPAPPAAATSTSRCTSAASGLTLPPSSEHEGSQFEPPHARTARGHNCSPLGGSTWRRANICPGACVATACLRWPDDRYAEGSPHCRVPGAGARARYTRRAVRGCIA